MKIIWRVALVLAVVLLGFWVYKKLFPSDEEKISKLLQTVAESVSFTASEGNIKKLAKVNRFGDCFSPDVSLEVNVPGRAAKIIEGRDELVQLLLAARTTLAGAEVEFLDAKVELDPGQESAVVNLTVKATISGEKDLQVQELKFLLKQTKNGWVITRVETVRTMGL